MLVFFTAKAQSTARASEKYIKNFATLCVRSEVKNSLHNKLIELNQSLSSNKTPEICSAHPPDLCSFDIVPVFGVNGLRNL